jgi:hypothetical protein
MVVPYNSRATLDAQRCRATCHPRLFFCLFVFFVHHRLQILRGRPRMSPGHESESHDGLSSDSLSSSPAVPLAGPARAYSEKMNWRASAASTENPKPEAAGPGAPWTFCRAPDFLFPRPRGGLTTKSTLARLFSKEDDDYPTTTRRLPDDYPTTPCPRRRPWSRGPSRKP